MLFIRKNLETAHSSSTQVTEINTRDLTTALIETDHTILPDLTSLVDFVNRKKSWQLR